ncbi:MAG TPA: response regulator [bacterium]|nr:response regulator [bacterium]HNT66037.1 response regulator [bacterium]HOX85530.1 response regulator [bacterium]HPG44689.1 response regulator [bacterium]HPM99404.1 response regulator [bacterium]
MAQKILIIDDDFDLVEINKAFLQKAGFQVDCAYNGQEGLQKIRTFAPHLIILDVMMTSVGEGFEVARKIRMDKEMGKIPILMLSSVNREVGFRLRIGPDEDWNPVNAFIDKPVDYDKLINKVTEILNSQKES